MRENPSRHDGMSAFRANQAEQSGMNEKQSGSSSRRNFMAASALIGAGAFGLGGPVGMAGADEDDYDDDNGDEEGMDDGDEMDGVEGD
ncbi:MAG: hypothetical protein IH933_15435, partial [Euryarchaeota archaeon]|nr:hypothetical protein [Euryarchaeota archaeon]